MFVVLSVYSSYLEKNNRLLMDCVDDLTQETNKLFNYQRQLAKQQQAKQQFLQKRVRRHCAFCVCCFRFLVKGIRCSDFIEKLAFTRQLLIKLIDLHIFTTL